jgi:hypothetical protein
VEETFPLFVSLQEFIAMPSNIVSSFTAFVESASCKSAKDLIECSIDFAVERHEIESNLDDIVAWIRTKYTAGKGHCPLICFGHDIYSFLVL